MLGLLARPTHRSYRTLHHHRLDRALLASITVSQRHLRTMASVASSSQPAVLPNGPHPDPREGKKQPKEKKDKAQSAASQYPLEVRIPCDTMDDDDH